MIKSLALAAMLYTPQVDSVSTEVYMASLEMISDMSKEISDKNYLTSKRTMKQNKYYHPVTKVEMSLKDYMELMFGKEFMNSKDKGTLKEY